MPAADITRPCRGRGRRAVGARFALCALIASASFGHCAAPEVDGSPEYRIIINKHSNRLKLYRDGYLVETYSVATGLYRCTVEGSFRVTDKAVVSRSGRGPLGSHWLGLNTKGRRRIKQVGIHGTNDPESIGKYSSQGCVRLRNADIAELYTLVPVGAKVSIVDVPEASAEEISRRHKAEAAAQQRAQRLAADQRVFRRILRPDKTAPRPPSTAAAAFALAPLVTSLVAACASWAIALGLAWVAAQRH